MSLTLCLTLTAFGAFRSMLLSFCLLATFVLFLFSVLSVSYFVNRGFYFCTPSPGLSLCQQGVISTSPYLFPTSISFYRFHKDVSGGRFFVYKSLSSFLYFLSQSLSGLALFSALLLGFNPFFIFLFLLAKLGVPPLHLWVLPVLKSPNLLFLISVTTIFKIPSLCLTSGINISCHLALLTIVLISTLLCSLQVAGISSFISVVTFSSIVQSSFIFLVAYSNPF